MTAPGMLMSLFTLLLFLGSSASILTRRAGAVSAWLNVRTVYFLVGLIVSCMYVRFVQTSSSTTGSHIVSPLELTDWVPLIVSLFGLGLSYVARRRAVDPNPFIAQYNNDESTNGGSSGNGGQI